MTGPIRQHPKCDCPVIRGARTHPPTCPAVAWITDVQRECQPMLTEMARARRRAEAEARNLVID